MRSSHDESGCLACLLLYSSLYPCSYSIHYSHDYHPRSDALLRIVVLPQHIKLFHALLFF